MENIQFMYLKRLIHKMEMTIKREEELVLKLGKNISYMKIIIEEYKKELDVVAKGIGEIYNRANKKITIIMKIKRTIEVMNAMRKIKQKNINLLEECE